MSSRLLALLVTALALGGWYVAVPPPAQRLEMDHDKLRLRVRGAVHVHTRRSDGSGTVDEVAAAASRAGLEFVILTDHGDGRHLPDPPAYRHGVLVIDAVEISTDGGHVVALGLPQAPYPLAGEARDVVEDIARLGGLSVAAHPDSARDSLRWHDWTVPVDGLEWLNGDSAWRDEGPPMLLRALVTYPIRPAETIATLLDRPDALLQRWDVLTQQRRVVAVAAGDAHARIGAGTDHRHGRGPALPVPGYEAVFRAFSIAVPDVTLSGEAHLDAGAVLAALRNGRVYSVVDALAGPAALSFTAVSGAHQAHGGDLLPLDGPVMLDVQTNAPPAARITLIRNGAVVAEASGARLQHAAAPEPAVYRVEVQLPGAPGRPPVPWVVSNPVYAGRSPHEPTVEPRRRLERVSARLGDSRTAWGIETSEHARGAIDLLLPDGESPLLFRYALGGQERDSAFVAFVTNDVAELRSHDALVFTARGGGPMRMSVQLRTTRGEASERWHRSVYLDEQPREIVVFFDDMRPRGPVSSPHPVLPHAESVLFVIDTVNTALGSSGRILLGDVRYASVEGERRAPAP